MTATRTAPAGTRGQRLRVLVVDDNRDSTVLMTMRLRKLGHEVVSVHDGSAALQAAFEYRPHLVFMDLGLPDVDGFTVAREIRRQAGNTQMLLVALTGYSDDADRRRSHEAGFDCHVVKPLENDTLTELLASRMAAVQA